jgi:tetratricopeptide (TPR) repeat protein
MAFLGFSRFPGVLPGVPLLAFAGLLLSCGPAPPAPEVEFGGCWAVYLPSPVCALFPEPNRRLVLWVRTPPADGRVEIRAGGRRLTAAGGEVSGGRRYRLPIPKPANRLTVSIVSPSGRRGPSWSLRLAEPEKPAWANEIDGLVRGGRQQDARTRLAQIRKTAPRMEQAYILRSLSILASIDGHQAEEERYLQLERSMEQAEKRWNREVEAATRLAKLYLDQRRLSAARKTLAELEPPAEAPADMLAFVAYHQGLLAEAVGDYRSALEQLRRADELSKRVGTAKFRWNTEQVLARILQDLGRTGEAADLFAALPADPNSMNPCDLGNLLTNRGWSQLRAREGGEQDKDPTALLTKAKAAFDGGSCTPQQRLNARLNLAFAFQQAGAWRDARRWLDEARGLGIEPDLSKRLWWDDLEARSAIAAGHPERALGLYETLAKRAERALSPEGRLRASLGLANARRALGQQTAAIAALAEADRRIDEQSWLVPAHEGRDTFLAQREEATRLYLQLLLEAGERQRALDLARRSRSRLLRQLAVRDRLAQLTPAEQRRWDESMSRYRALRDAFDRQTAQQWQLAGDEVERAREAQAAQLAEARDALDRALAALGDPGDLGAGSLSPPGPGEVILAYHPLPAGRWAGFAATVQGIDVATFQLPSEAMTRPEELSRILLAPFQSAIAASERVRVLAYGPLRSVDFHALPFAGAPLLARNLVVYSLDLPVRSVPAPASGRPAALLVSNPTSDLPAARAEADAVIATVRRWGSRWSLKSLDGPQARADAVLAALPGASLFHYAGHGIFAGFAGWDSALPLAEDSRLTLGDILALRPAPASVVLSSCDAGRSSDQASGEGIGLANAFLLAGSQAVIAATRPVDDRLARELMRELYRGWQPGVELSRQLQRAQMARRGKDPSAGAAWASFRLLVP